MSALPLLLRLPSEGRNAFIRALRSLEPTLGVCGAALEGSGEVNVVPVSNSEHTRRADFFMGVDICRESGKNVAAWLRDFWLKIKILRSPHNY